MTITPRAMRSIALPIGILAISGFALSACGGSSDSTTTTSAAPTTSAPAPAPTTSSPAPAPTTEPPAPNPKPEGDCTEAALNSAASNATGGSFGGVEEYTCDSGWAVVSGQLNDQYTNLVFKAEDGSWIPQEIQESCQSGAMPKAISDIAC